MDLAGQLRARAHSAIDKSYEESRGSRRLTVIAFGDLPGYVGFTFWEARARGWAPILAGRVDDAGDVAITFCCHDVLDEGLDQLSAFLSEEHPAPVQVSRPRARLTPVVASTSYLD